MFKAYTEFQKLKRIMVGQTFSSSIVDSDFLKDKLSPTTKRLLGQLLDETEEDYQELVKICEDFGVEVVRPEYSNTKFVANEHPYLMNPRDDLIVLDDCLVCSQKALGTSVDYLRTIAEEKDKVKRNVEHLEIIKTYKKVDGSTSIWTTENFSAIDAAITKGKSIYGG